jgi:hypothetical protein
VGVDILPAAANVLGEPFPNPSSGVVRIPMDLPSSNFPSELEVLDVQGRRVFTQPLHAVGPYEFLWDGTDDAGRIAAAGIYFISLRGAGFEQVRKFARVR